MNFMERTRRRFLKEGAALAGLAVGAGAIRSASGQTSQSKTIDEKKFSLPYGVPSSFETSQRLSVPSVNGSNQPGYTPLQDLQGIITPSSLHFAIFRFHGFPPLIDPREHRLLIHGLVDRPLIFTLEELKRLPSVSRIHFVECGGNSVFVEHAGAKTVQETHGWTSCSEWSGVLLSTLLREAGLKKEASWIIAEGADAGKHSRSIPLEKAMDDVLVAYAQNGEAVRPEQGYPLRLMVPGFQGAATVKWLRRIKVVDQPYMVQSESIGYTASRPNLQGKTLWFNFEMGPKSVITRPSGEQRLPSPGFFEITGLAWSGAGSIRRVEVSTDGGRSWNDAKIQEPVHSKAHTRFRMDWRWNGEEAVLQSRCTDDQGGVQPTLDYLAQLWGAPNAEWFKTAKTNMSNFNHIQPWKVNRDGSVHNALL